MSRRCCAIYTRKSSEEGLEQDFNSLDAQREACAAYVLSQASEGWCGLREVYDDGGISGGTLARPALQRLLADVAAGRVDIVVVYKVDRLTRSLLDFAKLVEAFDRAGVSFVSITQSFNTTISMDRLMLNMLLSFAQFEREVTAERIRDKIAASKARGMWMGGTPPLGYRPDGRSLAIVEDDASVIRAIFQRYLAIGNVRLLADQLARTGTSVPARTLGSGRQLGGGAFSRGHLYKILSNPIYVGEIHHKGTVHQALHAAIIDRPTWDAVQAFLADHTRGQLAAGRIAAPSLLAGLIVDEAGEAMVATHACKGKVRYRYYVSRALQHQPGSSDATSMRIPAREIEAAVIDRTALALDDPLSLLASIGIVLQADELSLVMARATALAGTVRRKEHAMLRGIVARVEVRPGEVLVALSTAALATQLQVAMPPHTDAIIPLHLAVRLTRTGRALRLIHSNGRAASAGTPEPALVKLVLQAQRWWARLANGTIDVATLAREQGITRSYVSRDTAELSRAHARRGDPRRNPAADADRCPAQAGRPAGRVASEDRAVLRPMTNNAQPRRCSGASAPLPFRAHECASPS